MDPSDGRFAPPRNEPIFNVPLLALLVAASMPALFLFQSGSHTQWIALAFVPADLRDGRWGGLVSSMLLHGSWPHATLNAIWGFLFGVPVARLLRGPSGALAFMTLYVGAGVFGALGYGLLHWNSYDPLVGASGGVFGLMGAATRLFGGAGRVLPLTHSRVVTWSIVFMGINLVSGLIGFAPGAEGARIAWEAHAFGFLFGILAIGPLAWLFGRPPEPFDSAPDMGDPRA